MARLFLWRNVVGICGSLTGRDGAPREWRPLPLLDYGRDFQLALICEATDSPIATQSQHSLYVGAHVPIHTHMHFCDKSVWNRKDRTQTWKMNLFCFTLVRESFFGYSFIYTDSRILTQFLSGVIHQLFQKIWKVDISWSISAISDYLHLCW